MKNQYQARLQNAEQMNAQMNAQFAVVRNTRTNTELSWTRTYLGIMTYRKYRSLLNEADKANSVLSLQERQNGGFVGYVGVAVSTLEGGIDGMALRTWIQGTTGKAYDVRTAKLIQDEKPVYNPSAPVQVTGLTVAELKDIHYAARAYISNGKIEPIASRLCKTVDKIHQAILAVDPNYVY